MNTTEPDGRLLQDIRAILRFHRSLGINGYPANSGVQTFLHGQRQTEPDLASAAAPDTLQTIRLDLGDCQRCRLHKTRQRIIFGEGNPKARLFIISGTPSEQDDTDGLPFSGEARLLLDKMLQAIGLKMADVYLTNIVKCHDTGDTAANDEAIRTCQPFLLKQLAAVAPKIICVMGPLPAQSLLNSTKNIFQLRGRWFDFQGIKLMPTFHPSFLIKNADMKKAAWHDLQAIQKHLAGA